MFLHDDDQEDLIIGEAALNLVRDGQEVNQVSLLGELDLMASKANNTDRLEKIKGAIYLLKKLSSIPNRNKAVSTWMMVSFPDDDGKHH